MLEFERSAGILLRLIGVNLNWERLK